MKIRLQEILEAQDKTIYSLSKEIGVAQNNLSKIIKGETTSIKYDILENLCIALKITPNDIFKIDYPYPSNQLYSLSIMNNYNEDEPYNDPLAGLSPEEIKEVNKISLEHHIRFDKELKLDKMISNFIDKILEGLFISLKFESSITSAFEKYKGYDIFTTSLKVENFYNYFYRFLNHYSNKDNVLFIKFINDIQHIYENGGLGKLTDDELEELENDIEFLINENNQKD